MRKIIAIYYYNSKQAREDDCPSDIRYTDENGNFISDGGSYMAGYFQALDDSDVEYEIENREEVK